MEILPCGKSGGYYGCHQVKRKTCINKLRIPKKRLEEILLEHLLQNLITAENLKYVYDNEEKEIVRYGSRRAKRKRYQQEKIQAELQNLLNFVKAGNFSKVVSEALTDAESRSDNLKYEMQGLEFQRSTPLKLLLGNGSIID